MESYIRQRRDTPEGPEEWSVSNSQKTRDILLFVAQTLGLTVLLGAPIAAVLAALYWNQGLGGTENLPWIIPSAAAVSLVISVWISRPRLWWSVRFEDYRLRVGNRITGKVIPCELVRLVRSGRAEVPTASVDLDGVVSPETMEEIIDSMDRMVPLEVVSEGAGRARAHLSLHDATDLLHFLHWQCPEAVIVHRGGERVLPRSRLGQVAARRRVAKVNLVTAGLQISVALVLLGSCLATLAFGSLDQSNPVVLAGGLGVLVGVGYLFAGAVYSLRRSLRSLKKAREEATRQGQI